jgi:hypothetical protein
MRYFFAAWLLTLPVFADTCLQCHGNHPAPATQVGRQAPLLPEAFSMRWKMYEFVSKERPPFAVIPKPFTVLPGATHYDWTKRRVTEIYESKCIDIFPGGRDYPCQFLSRESKTHLIRYADKPLKKIDSCCLWSRGEFWGPRPDVVRNMAFHSRAKLGKNDADWWLLDIPTPGPFGFGFYPATNEPAAFWFPVISGWVQQNFEGFVAKAPDAGVFDLPDACRAAPVCEEN